MVVILQRSRAATDLNLVILRSWQNASVSFFSTEPSDRLGVKWKEGERGEQEKEKVQKKLDECLDGYRM